MDARLAAAFAAFVLAGCSDGAPPPHLASTGDAEAGRTHFVDYGCGACHVAEGVRAARGEVGPSLIDYAGRAYVAGVAPNTHANLVRFLVDPAAVKPGTAMPDVGLDAGEAEDIAAFLHASAPRSMQVHAPRPLAAHWLAAERARLEVDDEPFLSGMDTAMRLYVEGRSGDGLAPADEAFPAAEPSGE